MGLVLVVVLLFCVTIGNDLQYSIPARNNALLRESFNCPEAFFSPTPVDKNKNILVLVFSIRCNSWN